MNNTNKPEIVFPDGPHPGWKELTFTSGTMLELVRRLMLIKEESIKSFGLRSGAKMKPLKWLFKHY